jgi:hypothetical protein
LRQKRLLVCWYTQERNRSAQLRVLCNNSSLQSLSFLAAGLAFCIAYSTVILAGVSPVTFLDLPATATSTYDAAAVTFDPLPLLLLLPPQIDQLLRAREAGLSHAPAADR